MVSFRFYCNIIYKVACISQLSSKNNPKSPNSWREWHLISIYPTFPLFTRLIDRHKPSKNNRICIKAVTMGSEKECSPKIVNMGYRKSIKKVTKIQLSTTSLVKRGRPLSLNNLNLPKGESSNRISLNRNSILKEIEFLWIVAKTSKTVLWIKIVLESRRCQRAPLRIKIMRH